MKYEFMRKGNVVLGRVLEQDESTRNGRESDAITLYNDDETRMRVCSFICPDLGLDIIYLWGYDHDLDNKYAVYEFGNGDKAKKYYNKVKTTLEHYNKYLKDNTIDHDDANTEHIAAKTVGDPDILLVNFVRMYEKVLMKILFQDKEITGRHPSFVVPSSPMIVRTCNAPALDVDKVFLRGINDEFDNNIVSMDFDSENNAKKYFDDVCYAVSRYVTACKEKEPELNQYSWLDDYCIIGG